MENATSNGMCSDSQDPDYQLFNSGESHQNIFEKNARSTAAKKISKIIEAEFMKEINNKKDEIHKIFKELSKACKMLHYLRFAIVTDFYNQENTLINDPQVSAKQSRPHPTVNAPTKSVPVVDINFANDCLQELDQENKRKRKIKTEPEESKKKCLQSVDRKIETSKSNITEIAPTIYANYKTKQRIIVGNISKWIPPDLRGNNASHKWTVYIRDSEKSDLGQIISKVRFFLHPSYKPNDVVELISPPFHLARLGWGEFPIRVQLHFSNGIDKPVDIIHHLKLDRTFTGLQTIGSETVADLWINMKDTPAIPIPKETKKQEIEEIVLNNIKEEKSLDKQKEEPKTIPENKTSYESVNFYTDHDYIVTNVKYDPEPSCHSQKVLKNHTIHNSQNSIIETETCSSHNFKKINLGQNLIENPRTLLKINHKKVLLNKTVYISAQNDLTTVELNGNSTINDKHKLDCFNNGSSLLNLSDIDEKRIYLKISNRITSEENARALVNLIDHAKPGSLYDMLKFVARRIPFITEKSTDLHYKLLYPYTSESYDVFSNCSSAKQRSLERYRAMSALEVMNNTKCYNYTCTVKEFITWARRYSYTPYLDLKNIHKMCTSSETVKLIDDEKYRYSSTVSDEIKSWLTECHNVSPSIKNHDKKDNDLIDIVNTSSSAVNIVSVKQNSKVKNNSLIFMEYPENQNSLNEFVCRTSQKIGIKLTNEEIIPGVLHSSASVLLTKAVECLIDELTRVAFACSLDKCKTEEDVISIESDDVRMALLKKEEFLIFTNAGLGSDG